MRSISSRVTLSRTRSNVNAINSAISGAIDAWSELDEDKNGSEPKEEDLMALARKLVGIHETYFNRRTQFLKELEVFRAEKVAVEAARRG
jgi:hypothetical protein